MRQLRLPSKHRDECITDITGMETELITKRRCFELVDIHEMQWISSSCMSSPLENLLHQCCSIVGIGRKDEWHLVRASGRCNEPFEVMKQEATAILVLYLLLKCCCLWAQYCPEPLDCLTFGVCLILFLGWLHSANNLNALANLKAPCVFFANTLQQHGEDPQVSLASSFTCV